MCVYSCVCACTAQDPSGYDGIFKLMKESKYLGGQMSHVASAASSAVKTACDIGSKAIIVLSESGETVSTGRG